MMAVGLLTLLIQLFLLVGVNGEMFSSVSGMEGKMTTLTCNLENTGYSGEIEFVNSLKLSKYSLTSKSYEQLAVYLYSIATSEVALVDEIPKGELNNKKVNGVNMVNDDGSLRGNQRIASLSLEFRSLTCSDEGSYLCQVDYYETNDITKTTTVVQNLTVSGAVEKIIGTALPDNIVYTKDENVTFTCRTNGPVGTEFEWRFKECGEEFFASPNFNVWPEDLKEYIRPGEPERLYDDCKKNRFVSSLINVPLNKVRSSMNMRLCEIQCRAGTQKVDGFSSFIVMGDWNKTIVYGERAIPEPGTSNQDGGVSVGAIVGPIIGVLALIVLIALLVYLCWYRKRSKDHKYGDDTVDKSDSNNVSVQHGPPPVFYTKPDKSYKDPREKTVIGINNDALDTSYDSKNSTTRGTTLPDATGPPRYEKEHMSRQNRGYDDTNGNNGRIYGSDGDDRRERAPNDYVDGRLKFGNQGGDRENRPYRDRQYEDEVPRRNRYSTEEDGTNNPAEYSNYGDPNMGTSI